MFGTDETLNAWITCNEATTPVVWTVMVPGRPGQGTRAENMKFRLRDLMLGRTAGPVDQGGGGAAAGGAGGPPASGKAVEDDWCFACRGTPREKTYRFSVQAPVQRIRVRVRAGDDDTGDRSVEVLLADPDGSVVLSRSAGRQDWAEWTVAADGYGVYELTLRDLDTVDGGRYPGNGGSVEVVLLGDAGPVTDAAGAGAGGAAGSRYRHVPGGYISGHNMRSVSGSPEDCMEACDRDPRCKSFDYHVDANKCDLSDVTFADVPGRVGEGSSRYDHYEKQGVETLREPRRPAASARTN